MTNDAALYLVIDQGGHASRVIVFDHHGEIIAHSQQAVSVRHPAADQVEQDPEELITSIRQAIDQAIQQLGERKTRLIVAGLASQRSSIVCWDRRDGAALSPVISWQDRRNREWLQQFDSRHAWIHARTGLPVTPHYGASKLRWCLDHLPAVQTAYAEGHLALGPVAAYYLFRQLANAPHLIDPANAGRTQLWNIQSGDWDPALLELFAIPAGLLPQCVDSSYAYGDLELDGLKLPLRLLMGDQPAALYAHGRPESAVFYVNIGTGAFIQSLQPQRQSEAGAFLQSVIYRSGDKTDYAIEGTVNGAGSALDWLCEQYQIDHLFDHLSGWLQTVEDPPLFINGISGLGSPFWVANLDSRFIGDAEYPAKAVAVIESIAFLIMENISGINRLTTNARQITITGGLSALDSLCQRLADISGLTVMRPGECEATARGCAFLLAGQPRDWLPVEPLTSFDPRENLPLKDRYQRWRSLLQQAIND